MIYLEIRYLEYDVEQLVNDSSNSIVKFRNTYDINIDADKLYNDLNNLICVKRQDGFYIRVNKSLNDIQVIIEINIYEHLDENYNNQNESESYEHILSYFENLNMQNVEEQINECIDPDMLIYTHELSEEKFAELKQELSKYDIDVVKLNKSIHRQEQGAGGWWEEFIIGVICSGVTYDLSKNLVKSIITKVLESPYTSEGLDVQTLLDSVTEVIDTNRTSLKISEFKLSEDGKYSVVLYDRYDTYLIVCKSSGEIEQIKKQQNSYTHI